MINSTKSKYLSRAHDLGFANWQHKVRAFHLCRDIEGNTVHQLIFQEHNRVRVTDGSLGNKERLTIESC